MHSIKRQARRDAWQDSYNPFARQWVRRANTLGLEDATSQISPRPSTSSVEPAVTSRPDVTITDKQKCDSPTSYEAPTKVTVEPVAVPDPKVSPAAQQTSAPVSSSTLLRLKRFVQKVLTTSDIVYLLFVFVPVGFVLNYLHATPTQIFAINLIAMLPSAVLLERATEAVVEEVGDTVGGILSTTFSNATLVISSVFLLKTRQLQVLQGMLLGSIISHLLLMTGLSFLFGGIPRIEQHFDATLAQSLCTLLLLAILSLLMPTASHLLNDATTPHILQQSRGTAVIILISYGLWLFFQLETHRKMFNLALVRAKRAELQPRMVLWLEQIADKWPSQRERLRDWNLLTPLELEEVEEEGEEEEEDTDQQSDDAIDNSKRPKWFLITRATTIVIVSTTILAFNTEFATSSIQGLLQQHGISQLFVGFVILPLVSNDHLSILTAVSDNMNYSLSLTLGRCMQTSMMVVPLVVIIGWGMDRNFSLDFDGFSIAALFASMIMVSYVVQEGRSNWLVGALLIKAYVIIGLAAFYIH